MTHLIAPIRNIALAACRATLVERHAFLAARGAAALAQALAVPVGSGWGQQVKRRAVELHAVGERPRYHNLFEVVNQCATVEHLINALAWAEGDAQLRGYHVSVCHPTTSSAKHPDAPSTLPDNDLVLINPDGALARFEVSDVASQKDGNGKEERDLISLGVLQAGRGQDKFATSWPSGRLFLVVSEKFAARRRAPTRAWLKGALPHCRYREVGVVDTTAIFEVVRGSA